MSRATTRSAARATSAAGAAAVSPQTAAIGALDARTAEEAQALAWRLRGLLRGIIRATGRAA